MEYDFIRIIAEIHVIKDNVAFQRYIIHTSICLVCMLPRPVSGTLFALCQFSVFFSGIDQGHIAFVCLHGGIHQTENTFRTGKCHYYGVKLA